MNQTQKDPVFSFLNLLGQLILVSILWTVCCLPIVTIGAASTDFATPQLAALDSGVGSSFYLMIGLAFLGTLPLSVIYPVISRFYHRGASLVRFTLMLTGRHPHIIIASALLLIAGILLALSNAAALLFVPGVVAYVQSLMLEPVFKKYSEADDSQHYETWYGQEKDS